MPFLSEFGADAKPHERYVREGKVITAAGVSAGIDMALYLAALGRMARRFPSLGRELAQKLSELAVEAQPRRLALSSRGLSPSSATKCS